MKQPLEHIWDFVAFAGGALGGLFSSFEDVFLITTNFEFNLGHVMEYTINVCIGGFVSLGLKLLYDRLSRKDGEAK